jgi:LmbE family N-acetylglucosaminyl deacetylase
MLVISPHLDDAALGCGQLLAASPGSAVLTVFAGAPDDADRLTEWDARCGFASAHDAITQRRAEDARALRLLGAQPHWLTFCDDQYGQACDAGALRNALLVALKALRPQRLLYPMGLFHSDHKRVHDAVRAVLPHLPGVEAWMYEDALYRGMPGLLQRRLAEFANAQWRATPVRLTTLTGSAALKAEAVQAYASQVRTFGPHGLDDAAEPERCWLLVPEEAEEGDDDR